jgi:hypothetical protein
MNLKKSIKNTTYLIALMISLIYLGSCNRDSRSGWIIMTQVPASVPDPVYEMGHPWKYLPGSRLAAIKPGMSSNSSMILTEGFFSACSPALSYDGKYLVFTGKKDRTDHWQIWIMNLKDMSIDQVTKGDVSCLDPVYLPSGRIVFSMVSHRNNPPPTKMLYSCNPDGSEVKQISFHPHADQTTSVLLDGRLLTVSRQLSPLIGEQKYLALRPDGTKAELFYQPGPGGYLWGKGIETKNQEVVFIESSATDPEKGELIAVSQNSPLNSRRNLGHDLQGSFQSASEIPSGNFLVSYRDNPYDTYGVYNFDPRTGQLGEKLAYRPDFHIFDPVVVGEYTRPRILPSAVNESNPTGLLLCQDINLSRIADSSESNSNLVQVWGRNGLMGEVQAEEDGSFYLKMPADTPVQIKTVDADGNIIRGPSDWIWLRPNERRGCVGCHADPELVPDNRVPMAVNKPAVDIPAKP